MLDRDPQGRETSTTCTKPQVEGAVPVYNKRDVSGLQIILRDKFVVWASNGSKLEEIWNNFKNIVYESKERFVPHKTLRKISDPKITSRLNN